MLSEYKFWGAVRALVLCPHIFLNFWGVLILLLAKQSVW